MFEITMAKTNYVKKEGTKTVWIETETETKTITEDQYKNITCDETLQWFRRLGGSETAEKSYTIYDYCITKLTSTSPDKQEKTVRKFKFRSI